MSRVSLSFAFLLFVPLAARAANPATIQTTTALVHADLAMNAHSLETAKAHLHHVVNCLVGPDGKGFDAHAENPCEGMGSGAGALHDEATTPERKQALERTLEVSERGLHSRTLAVAHVYSEWAAATLQDLLGH